LPLPTTFPVISSVENSLPHPSQAQTRVLFPFAFSFAMNPCLSYQLSTFHRKRRAWSGWTLPGTLASRSAFGHNPAMKRLVTAIVPMLVCLVLPAVAEEEKPAAVGTAIGQTVPAFEAEALVVSKDDTRATQFSSHDANKVMVYMFMGTKCPATTRYVGRFRQLEKEYEPKGVEVMYVYPSRQETNEVEVGYHRQHSLTGRLIHDKDGRITRLLGARRTSEALLTDKQGTILYRGGADDNPAEENVKNRWLATAIDEHLAGKPVTQTTSRVFACGLRY
jgi:peroxiredoxin